jgi:hypothetical protein
MVAPRHGARIGVGGGDSTFYPHPFTADGADNIEDDLVQQAFASSLPDKECPCSVVSVCSAVNNAGHRYGPHGLVTRIAPPEGNPWNFYYDGQLNRYCIDKGGEATYYLWDGLNLLEERAADGSLIARYTHGATPIYGIGSVVEVERHVGAATYFQYLVMDHRGTAYKVTDEAGATQIAYTLDAFGRELAAPTGLDPTVPNDLAYQTNWLTIKVAGRSLGLSRFRLYDPANAVFLRRDFLRYLNKYRCWSNNPPGQVDRDGLADVVETDPLAPSGGAEHRGGSPSTREKHEAGQRRKEMDRGGERADVRRRPPLKRPRRWRGPWPPKGLIHCILAIIVGMLLDQLIEAAEETLEPEEEVVTELPRGPVIDSPKALADIRSGNYSKEETFEQFLDRTQPGWRSRKE